MIQCLSLPWYLSTVFTSTLFPAVGLLEAVPEKYVANDPTHQAEALTSFYESVNIFTKICTLRVKFEGK